jgi:uncharacterized membrane protein
MNLRDPETMNTVIGNVLRYGVILSGLIVVVGILRLVSIEGSSETTSFLTYGAAVPHDSFPTTFSALMSGLASFNSYSIIELGVIVLIATPVSRVLISVFLFAAERDDLYVAVTATVLTLLLFSMLVTPLIPGFHA